MLGFRPLASAPLASGGIVYVISTATASATGTASVLATGVALANATASATGSASVSGTLTATSSGIGSSTGAASSSFVGASTWYASATATATATLSGVGASTWAASFTASGSAVIVAYPAVVGSAFGIASINGSLAAISSGTATASGSAYVSGVGAATDATTGTATGVGFATAIGAAVDASLAFASGIGVATGIGASTAASLAAANGSVAVSGVMLSTWAASFTASGASTTVGYIGSLTKFAFYSDYQFAGLTLANDILAASVLGGYNNIPVPNGTSIVNGIGGSIWAARGVASGYANNIIGVGTYCLDPHLNKLTAATARTKINLIGQSNPVPKTLSSGKSRSKTKLVKNTVLLVPINGGALASYPLATQPITAYEKEITNTLAAVKAKQPKVLSRHTC